MDIIKICTNCGEMYVDNNGTICPNCYHINEVDTTEID